MAVDNYCDPPANMNLALECSAGGAFSSEGYKVIDVWCNGGH